MCVLSNLAIEQHVLAEAEDSEKEYKFQCQTHRASSMHVQS